MSALACEETLPADDSETIAIDQSNGSTKSMSCSADASPSSEKRASDDEEQDGASPMKRSRLTCVFPSPIITKKASTKVPDAARTDERFAEYHAIVDALRRRRATYPFKNVTSHLAFCPARKLGRGTHGSVIAVMPHSLGLDDEVLEHGLAVKAGNSSDDNDVLDYLDSRSDRQATALEARIAVAVTDELLGFDRKGAAMCPNFVACFAFQHASTALRYKSPGRTVECSGSRVCASMFGEVFDGNSLSRTRNSDVFVDTRVGFSAIVQTLVAIAAMARCGISHNDLGLCNVLRRAVPSDTVLRYVFPAEGRLEALEINLHAASCLIGISDFGIASVSAWEANDPRLLAYGRDANRLGEVYFGRDSARNNALPAEMYMRVDDGGTDTLPEWHHPLMYSAVGKHERDVASIMSHFLISLTRLQRRDEPFCPALMLYVRTILGRLRIDRPRDGEAMLRFVRSVVHPSFVRQIMGSSFMASAYLNAADCAGAQVYRLPTAVDGERVEQRICREVQREVAFPGSFFCTG